MYILNLVEKKDKKSQRYIDREHQENIAQGGMDDDGEATLDQNRLYGMTTKLNCCSSPC